MSNMFENPEDRFSRVAALILLKFKADNPNKRSPFARTELFLIDYKLTC